MKRGVRDSMALRAPIVAICLPVSNGNRRLSARGCAAQQIEAGEKRCAVIDRLKLISKNYAGPKSTLKYPTREMPR
ncbi:MAG TPA: hypothetical protein VJX94_25560 [Stellaceae bacterium]|nr:hypothetical protein [Stellaceae bacterium]